MRQSSRRKTLFMMSMGISSLMILGSNLLPESKTSDRTAPYTITDMGVGFYPHKINNTGTVVGILVGNRGMTEALVWQQETGRNSLPHDSENLTFANDISDTGVVVGHIGDQQGTARAYSWMSQNTEFSFTPFEQGQSVAYAVNSAGHMAGQIGESAIANYQAFHYEPDSGIRNLGTLGGHMSQATGLNDSGEVVGWSVTGDQTTHAFHWQEGTGMVDLGTLGGKRSFASAINTEGKIVGQSETENGTTHALLYENGEMKELADLGGAWSLASDINDRGLIVGQSEERGYGVPQFAKKAFDLGSHLFSWGNPEEKSRAVVWQDGAPFDLNDLTSEDSGWQSLSAATGVNGHGQIVGFGKKDGHLHGFLLTPQGFEESDDSITLTLNSSFLSTY